MAEKIPIRVSYSGDTPTGIAEYQQAENDYIPVTYGGTGQVDTDRGKILVGDLTDSTYKTKKFTDTSGMISCIFDETWLTATGLPVNQTTNGTTQFYAGETIYQGDSISTATASAVILENTGVSLTFKINSITGTFTAGGQVWGQNSLHESGVKRSATLASTNTAIDERETIKFFIGTLNATTGEYTLDCGTL